MSEVDGPDAELGARGAVRILGIDPGSVDAGFGVIDAASGHGRLVHVAHGQIRLGRGPFLARLTALHRRVGEIIEEYRPDELAIEEVYVGRGNPGSVVKLGQARGAAIVAAGIRGVPVAECNPRRIKQVVTGDGDANKARVMTMVSHLLGLSETDGSDAADALAIALTRARHRSVIAGGASPAPRATRRRSGGRGLRF